MRVSPPTSASCQTISTEVAEPTATTGLLKLVGALGVVSLITDVLDETVLPVASNSCRRMLLVVASLSS